MRILVLGAGAIGGVFGARLMQAGAQVAFAVRPRRAEVLRERGLAVAFPDGDFRQPVDARLAHELGQGHDAVLLACKAYDLAPAVEAIRPALGPETFVVPLLNGVAHFDALDRDPGAGRVAGGTCHVGCSLEADGSVRQMSAIARIAFGPRPGMLPAGRRVLRELAELFAQTPVQCRYSEDIMQDVWEKFAFLATLASTTYLMRAAIGDIVRVLPGREMVTTLFDGCAAVAAHAGFPPRAESRRGFLELLTDPASTTTSSMLRDLEAGKRTEAEHIVGDMLRRARLLGPPPPLLEAAWVHLAAREARLAREHGRGPA